MSDYVPVFDKSKIGVQCARKLQDGARCPDAAEWVPMLMIFPANPLAAYEPVLIEVSIGACAKHKDELQPLDVITDAGWEGIAKIFKARKLGVPNKEYVGLKWRKNE